MTSPPRTQPFRSALDRNEQHPGYWPSAWPVECGGNRRQKSAIGRLDAADGEPIRIEVQRWVGGQLKTVESETSQISLSFADTFDPILEGTVERFIDGAVFAAFLPCLLRNQHGSIDPFSGS